MTFALTPDTDREDLTAELGRTVDRDDVRNSDSRRRRLQKNVRRLSRDWDTTVILDPEHPTSRIEPKQSKDDEYEVVISGQAIPQPVTDYEPRAWDWLVQRALGVHEAGHLRYTDFEDWETRVNRLDPRETGVAHTLHNALEDAAIEQQIVRRWPNYYVPLRTLRANLFDVATLGIPDPERGGTLYPMAHAVHASVLDRWMREVYNLDVGVFDALADQTNNRHHFTSGTNDADLFQTAVVPLIQPVVEEVLSTPTATKRNETIFSFVQEVLDLLDRADADGQRQQEGRYGDGATGEGMPDDARENLSDDAADDAESLAEPVETDIDAPGTDPGEGELGLDEIGSVEVAEEIRRQAREEAAEDATVEAGVTDAHLDEYEEMRDALAEGGNSAADGLSSETVFIPDDSWAADPTIVRRAKDGAKPLARIFRTTLQHERRTAIERGKRRGRLDSRRLYRTGVERNPPDLKYRREQPEEKDYYMAFVLDRSSSMNRKVTRAETAVGTMIFALEDVGVETMLLELYDATIWLAKPFGSPPELHLDRMFHGNTCGSTPLSSVLHVVRSRLNREARRDTQKAMIVVTDDSPANPREFADTIAATTFPVLGVNLAKRPSTSTYTRSVAAEPGDDLQAKLRQLATEVLL